MCKKITKKIVLVLLMGGMLAAPVQASWFSVLQQNSMLRKVLRGVGAVGSAAYGTERLLHALRCFRVCAQSRGADPLFQNLANRMLKEGGVSVIMALLCYLGAYALFGTLKKVA